MARQPSKPTAFLEALTGVRLPKAIKDHLKNHALWSKWSEIVGLELSKVTSPAEIRGSSLIVNVTHQAWAQQLYFLSPSILGKIRVICPEAEIRELEFKVGKVVALAPKPNIYTPKTGPVVLSERMEMTLRAIEDQDLRNTIRLAMESAVRHGRSETA